jgi:protein phosphatase
MDIGLERGDRFLLCTDGVHDVMEDDDIRAILPGGTPAEVAARISARVTERGAPDNFSIVCVDVVAGEQPKISDEK